MNGVLPDILRRYRARYPGVALSLQERSPDELIRELHEHRIEMAFLFAPYHDKALHSRCVSIQHLIAALPDGHPFAPQPVIDVTTPGPMILPTKHETPGLFSRISALFDGLGIQPNCSTPETWPSV